MSLKLEDYKKIASVIHTDIYTPLTQIINCDYTEASFEGTVIAKERPRKGKGGRHYTPPKTVAFEKAVAEWGKKHFTPVRYPIRVEIIVCDKTDDDFLLSIGPWVLAFDMHNDLDNICKSILDGLNGVLFKDDKQIVHLVASRTWSKTSGFTIRSSRCGLSKQELEQLRKHIK